MADGFDLSKLAVGDEVGIESLDFSGRPHQTVSAVAEVTPAGGIRLAGGAWFYADGRSATNPKEYRLVAPTDEGRAAGIREIIVFDLNLLQDRIYNRDLAELRKMQEMVAALIDATEIEAARVLDDEQGGR